MSDSSSDVNPLDALAEEFVARHRRGEQPSLDEFIARRPDLADDIRDLFPALVLMEGARPDKGDATGPFAAGPAPALQRLGDYRILREVGRGGMGVVYEAEQESLGRHVALKVLPAHSLLEPQRLQRFRREAKAAARLHHTNIVPVFGVGEADGFHYYVMQFIQGLGLDQVLAELKKLRPAPAVADGGPPARDSASAAGAARSLLTGRFQAEDAPAEESDPPSSGSSAVRLPGQGEGSAPSHSGGEYWRGVARIGVQVADALAYAHAQGVLHRDVKPSNLLLDARGNVWVTDFGLAKSSDGEDLTQTGDIVGTLRYMAPECFSGKGDARADVYSLGLTLYELLTLRPAFAGGDRHQLLGQVMHGEPPRPRSVNRDVPRDLETVVLKAIARDPTHRYQTAGELADDLRRFVDDRPVRARRISAVEQLWRWGRRNPALAVLTTVVLLLLLVGTTGSAVAAYYFSRLAGAEAKARIDADNANLEIQKKANQLHDDFERLNRANALMESGRLHAAAGQFDQELADYTAAVEQRPDVSTVWLTRGQFYLQFFCWDEAAADFARGFELQPPADPYLWLSHAWLRVYVGDQEGYRRVCSGMLDKFGQTTDVATMQEIAQACTAGPDALDDFTPLINLIAKPAKGSSNSTLVALWLYAHYRSGEAKQALRVYEADWASIPNYPWGGAVLALLCHAAGQDDKAQKYLAEFNQEMDKLLPNAGALDAKSSPQSPMDGYNLGDYLFSREATQQLKALGAVEHPLFWIANARGRVALGQWDAAAADVARAIALRPDDPQLHLAHSSLLAAQNRWEEAAADYDEILRQHSEDGSLWVERGRLYALQGRWDRAAADFNRALEQPNFSQYSDLGVGYQPTIIRWEPAVDALLLLRPRDAALWRQRALQFAQNGMENAAVAAWAKAVEARPDDPDLLYYRGMFFGQNERWHEAADDFTRVLELLPDSPQRGHLGPMVYQQLLLWDQALDWTLALRPTDGQLYAVLARWHIGRSEWDKALATFGEAVKLLPDDPDLHRERGKLYAQLGRWKEAAADFDRVVNERPLGEDWFQDACLRRLNGDAEGCLKLCAPLAERYGKTTDANQAFVAGRIAELTPDSGVDPALAVRWEERAVASKACSVYAGNLITDPGDVTSGNLGFCLHALGLAHYRAGHFEAAARWYRESMKVASDAPAAEPVNWLGLALVSHRLKQPDEARRCLDKATAWMKEANAGRPKEEAEFMPASMQLSDWLEYQILRREAETALSGPGPKPEK